MAKNAVAAKGAKKRAGQSTYDPTVVNQILSRMAEGKSLRSVCHEFGVSAPTVRRWVVEDKDGLAERYAHAREAQGHALAEQVVDDAEDESLAPDRARLRVDAKKWAASKILPRVYGDKVDVTSGGKAVTGCALVAGFPVAGGSTPDSEAGD